MSLSHKVSSAAPKMETLSTSVDLCGDITLDESTEKELDPTPEKLRKRHEQVKQSDIDRLERNRNEVNTSRATGWAVRCFSDWLTEKKLSVNFTDLTKSELNATLREFYGTVRNEKGEPYSISSYLGLRSGINRYLKDSPPSRSWCLMRDTEFTTSNNVFLGTLKKLRRDGKDRTTHHPVISESDIQLIRNSEALNPATPRGLVQKVWFDVQLHFGRRGKEGNRQLKADSFAIVRGVNGRKYATMTSNEATKNHSDFRVRVRESARGFMFEEPGNPLCPVASLEKYLTKLPETPPAFYLHPKRTGWSASTAWFTDEPMGLNYLATMLPRICKAAGTARIYTNHSIHSTANQKLSDAGLQAREMMSVSGHRSESSLQSCQPSLQNKKRWRTILANEQHKTSPVKRMKTTSTVIAVDGSYSNNCTLNDSVQINGRSSSLPSAVRHIGCQTDPLEIYVGTQMPRKALQHHTKSNMCCKSVGVGTTTGSLPTLKSRPAKRPRLELEEEDSVSMAVPEPHDSTYNPTDSVSVTTELTNLSRQAPRTTYETPKYIVYESCLIELFEVCPVCRRACEIKTRRHGTFLAVKQMCPHCQYFRQWKSQPIVGSTPAGNLQLSAAIYFSGASFFKLEKIFKAVRLKMVKYNTFRRYARMYLEPAIVHKWKRDQDVVLERLSHEKKNIVGGDMRAGSPGHSARFGSYSMMHLESNNIIDIQLVQNNEVGDGYHMEREGLKRSLELLKARGVTPDYILANHHPQIQNFLRELSITQLSHAWHLEKGSKAVYKFEKVWTNNRVLKDVEKLNSHHQTSSLEDFHSIILNFLPKNTPFPFLGMLCRLYLASMHFNENANRPQATTSEGDLIFKVKVSKKGECIAKPVKIDPTFHYVDDLMGLLFERVFENPTPFIEEVLKIPIPEDHCAQ